MPDLIERAAAKLNGHHEPPKPMAEDVVTAAPSLPLLERDNPATNGMANDRSSGLAAGPVLDAIKRRPPRLASLDVAALSRAGIMTPKSDSSRIVEEFRVIKRPLLTKALSGPTPHHDKANVILVTSARPGEGKSFVAYNLAMSIASERNLQVVLIDADLRSSLMSRLLDVPPGPGLIELLSSPDTDTSEVMLQTDFPNLCLLPAGGWANQSTELLASPRMVEIVRELAAGGDRIVILDAAPVLASSEPAVLAHNAGQIVLVVEAERTGRGAVEEAIGHLGACRNINLVLNKARGWLSGDQFGAYYGAKDA